VDEVKKIKLKKIAATDILNFTINIIKIPIDEHFSD